MANKHIFLLILFSFLFSEEVVEPQLPVPLPLQTLFVDRLVFIATGEVEDGRVSPTLWYSTPLSDDIDPEVDLVSIWIETAFALLTNKLLPRAFPNYENLVLSNELIKVELLPWKIWKADVSSVSPSSGRIDLGLTLEASAFQIFHDDLSHRLSTTGSLETRILFTFLNYALLQLKLLLQ